LSPSDAGAFFYFDGIEKIYADQPDVTAAEKDFRRSVETVPRAFFVHIELASLLLRPGARDEPFQEYSQALKYAPSDALIRLPVEEQIQRVTNQPSGEIPVLRNAFLE
jgi:tetratricopeptide (TPR) repeat protein